MAYEATSGAPGAGARLRATVRVQVARAASSPAVRAAWSAFAWSRLAILLVAVYAAATASGGIGARNEAGFGEPALTLPFGGLGDLLLGPLAHWDAIWYLQIAGDGYGGGDSPRVAFFPLYPLLARGVGELGGGGEGAVLLGAYAVSLAAFAGALILLHKLVALELGERLARPVLLLVCVFPVSFFFGAPYSESLFLLASVGAFYAARTGHWAWAGIAAGAASGTRSAGILLLLPLLILLFHGPRADRDGAGPHRPGREGLWLALAPAGLLAYAAYLGATHGDPLAFSSVQEFWNREFAGPLVGVWDGAVAAFDGARQLLSGSRETVYFEQAAGDPFRIAAMNLGLFGFLVFGLVAALGVLRRLPLAYGVYVVAALMLPLSYPVGPQPLMSLPRFLAVLFPLFMWLALVCEERRLTDRVAAVSAVVLGLLVSQFAAWQWVA